MMKISWCLSTRP